MPKNLLIISIDSDGPETDIKEVPDDCDLLDPGMDNADASEDENVLNVWEEIQQMPSISLPCHIDQIVTIWFP